ncbi:MAG: DUF3016 domain-containing protein [Hyphomicrobiaceae bacterium]
MTRRWTILLAMPVMALLPSPVAAAVKVTYITPARFSDAGSHGVTMDHFRRVFAQLGDRYLKRGQALDIKVLDIDLAGEFEPWRRHLNDVRIMRGITPPRIKLQYVLRQNGRVIARRTETISNMNYQMNASARYSNERFAYEDDMLRDWFRSRFRAMR